ncbi:hypothetical protein CMI47_07860 [Candidatus Pacearchaeota archaeon]|jgi:predicted dehydrogenase|nr:hypothetical protein [Candidatus Pacearchaeota archaeon]|tara:strand:- start:4410 stop:5252 length:843 start_codon:yes stop_codon:yes gene_type:complete
MNVVLMGYGSIGKRHTNNLIELGCIVRTIDIDEIDNVDYILKDNNFDFGLVCSPSYLHLEHILKLVENGIDFFCEKPLYSKKDLGLLNKIRILVNEKSLINMVGCNLRFNSTIKNFDFSDTKNIKVVFGYDLKKWHNDGKHLESYSANKNMGGGILLDSIHEFDYIYNWFGKIKQISGIKKKLGDVTVDTEDTVDAEILFESGVMANVHLDYLQPNYTRYFEKIVDDWGTEIYNIKPNNKMYIDEMIYFIDCVKSKKRCMNDINEAIYLIDMLDSIGWEL